MSLKQKTFSAIRWGMASAIGRAGINLLQVAVLARLLHPSDFGLMAVVVAILSFAVIFSDMGVSNAIVHYQNISHEELSSLYWLNVLTGAVLTLLFFVISPLIANAYGETALASLLKWASLSFVITAIGQQLRVVAEKELRFVDLARIEIFSAFTGVAVAIVWAFMKPSVYAFVAGQLTSVSITTILFWIILTRGWRPLFRLRLSEARRFIAYGGYMVGNNLTTAFHRQADILIGGPMFSATNLGLYSLPRDFSLQASSIVGAVSSRVGLPMLAKLQHDQQKLRLAYLSTLRMAASVSFPLFISIAVFSSEIVNLLFGSKWIASAPLLSILSLWVMLRFVVFPAGTLVFAVGRADRAFWWNAVLCILLSTSVWYAAQYGTIVMARVQLATSFILIILSWYFLVRPFCGAKLGTYLRVLAVPFIISLVAALIGHLGADLFVKHAAIIGYLGANLFVNNLARLMVGMFLGLFVYGTLSIRFNRLWYQNMKQLLRLN